MALACNADATCEPGWRCSQDGPPRLFGRGRRVPRSCRRGVLLRSLAFGYRPVMMDRVVGSLLALSTVLAMVGVLAVGCGGGTSGVRRCPDSPQVPCLLEPECTIDGARGCQMCRCPSVAATPFEQPDPYTPPEPQ